MGDNSPLSRTGPRDRCAVTGDAGRDSLCLTIPQLRCQSESSPVTVTRARTAQVVRATHCYDQELSPCLVIIQWTCQHVLHQTQQVTIIAFRKREIYWNLCFLCVNQNKLSSYGEIYRPEHLSRVACVIKKIPISGGCLGHFYIVLQHHFVGCNHPGETKPIFKVNTVRDQKSILPWPHPL